MLFRATAGAIASLSTLNAADIAGLVLDPQGRPVAGATIRLTSDAGQTTSGADGRYQLTQLPDGLHELRAEFEGLAPVVLRADTADGVADIRFTELASQRNSVVITANTLEPEVDLRNAEVFNRTLFTRDDQIFYQLNAGINLGQHEGGGKSLEVRRFGFNMDHGGVNGGLKVMVDGVQQNQGTQGHGQGYLGSLKSLSPELIEDVTILNGPFSAQYGDFSGLGVVQIHQRESLPSVATLRAQGGNFNTGRGFAGFSPDVDRIDAYVAYEGSFTDGPFLNPLDYRRDNFNANYTRTLGSNQKIGLRFLGGRNNFYSSGQIPLDLVAAGTLDRFGAIDPKTGGRAKLGTLSAYYSRTDRDVATLRIDGFVTRSLFDLFSNFTFFLNDPVNGDGIQQHDSRLQEGVNAQYTRTHRLAGRTATFVAGGNYHDSQINVGLYNAIARVPTSIATRANARVANGAGYAQETVMLFGNRLILTGGLRWDGFHYAVTDHVVPEYSGSQNAGRWQGKASAAYTPALAIPMTLHFNYGRGISSVDARGVVQRPDSPRIGTTDFYQAGVSTNWNRVGFSGDLFLIDNSNQQVYIPDDGSIELQGPSRAYGFEGKMSVALTRYVSLSGGLTKVANAFFRDTEPRVYVDSAPRFVANAALTLSAWRGWSGSFRLRAVNSYRLDGEDPSIRASGLTVFDVGIAKQVWRGVELNLSLDNLTDRVYYETQNYFESRVAPTAPVGSRIHATPGYPLTVAAGITLRLGGK